jgi:tetratricopeptide (TPR) repeat protein
MLSSCSSCTTVQRLLKATRLSEVKSDHCCEAAGSLCEVMIRPPAPPAGEQQGAAAAAALKDAGNAHFQAKRFEEALECYTRALALAPHNHLLWSNSSMARAALNQWFESEAVSYFKIRDL